MMKLKKILAVTMILTLLGSVSCGQTNVSEEYSSVISAADEVGGDDSLNKINDDEKNADSKADSSLTDASETASTTTSSKGASASTTTTAGKTITLGGGSSSAGHSSDSDSSSDTGNSSSSNANTNESPSAPNGNSSNNQNKSSVQSSEDNSTDQNLNSSNNNAGNTGNTPQDTPVSPDTETPTEEQKVYTAEIILGSSPQINGINASADGSRVVITGGGDYLVSGAVDDGQIEVNTTEKVKLYLNGVSITNYSGPAILVTDAKRFIAVLMEGTSSVLQDVNKDKINDGVICSNDTVEIKGKGYLDIIAGNAHGISSDDDVVIENGNINITSVKSGIIANDDITINDGDLFIQGGTNGIKSKGTININGGYSVISGGAKEEKSSIYSLGEFNYTGGYVFAAGNTVTAPTQTAYPYIIAGFNEAQPGGSAVSLQLDGYEMISMIPHNNFKCVMMLAPEINYDSSFAIDINGSWNGYYTITELQNIFTIF